MEDKNPILRNNFILLFLYTSLIASLAMMASDPVEGGRVLLYSMWMMFALMIQLFVNMLLGIYYQFTQSKGSSYFLSGILVVVIGFGVCFVPFFVKNGY